MEAKHTPGPWDITASVANDGRLIVENDLGLPVCAMSLRGVQGDTKVMEANAKLIAAAPELLEKGDALANLVERYFRGGDDGIPPATESEVAEAMYALRAAIARATA